MTGYFKQFDYLVDLQREIKHKKEALSHENNMQTPRNIMTNASDTSPAQASTSTQQTSKGG